MVAKVSSPKTTPATERCAEDAIETGIGNGIPVEQVDENEPVGVGAYRQRNGLLVVRVYLGRGYKFYDAIAGGRLAFARAKAVHRLCELVPETLLSELAARKAPGESVRVAVNDEDGGIGGWFHEDISVTYDGLANEMVGNAEQVLETHVSPASEGYLRAVVEIRLTGSEVPTGVVPWGWQVETFRAEPAATEAR